LAAVVMHNKVILFLMALSFLLFTLWWIALSYLAFPRIIFAWGMDRMGPKWFTDVNARWASPVKNYILGFVIAELLIALYVFWLNEPMQGLSVTALEIFSVFGVTAISAAIFPFSKRSKSIWEASPYRKWKLLGIPVVTLGAVVNIAYLPSWPSLLLPAHQPGGLHPRHRHADPGDVGTGPPLYWFWSWRANRTAGSAPACSPASFRRVMWDVRSRQPPRA
jgi:amino acid transporter